MKMYLALFCLFAQLGVARAAEPVPKKGPKCLNAGNWAPGANLRSLYMGGKLKEFKAEFARVCAASAPRVSCQTRTVDDGDTDRVMRELTANDPCAETFLVKHDGVTAVYGLTDTTP